VTREPKHDPFTNKKTHQNWVHIKMTQLTSLHNKHTKKVNSVKSKHSEDLIRNINNTVSISRLEEHMMFRVMVLEWHPVITLASKRTGSRNLTCPKTLPTIWHTYMTLVTKYQISAINSYWEKCDEKYLGRTEGWTEVKQYTFLPEASFKQFHQFLDLLRESG
jgi:hypothetical protein